MWTDEITISGDTQPGGKMQVMVKTANNGNGWFRLSSKMKKNDKRMIAFENIFVMRFLLFGRQAI